MRLQLSVLSYNLGNLWRRLGLPRRIKSWSLTSLQQRLMKTGGRLVKHARYYWLLLAEGHLNRKLFGQMMGRLAALPAPTARTSWRTRVAEDRRGRDVAKKPSAVAGTAQSGSIRRPEQQGKGYRTWQKCENRCIAAADRLPCPCHEGQNGNPG